MHIIWTTRITKTFYWRYMNYTRKLLSISLQASVKHIHQIKQLNDQRFDFTDELKCLWNEIFTYFFILKCWSLWSADLKFSSLGFGQAHTNFSLVSRITEAFSMEYITCEKPVTMYSKRSLPKWWNRPTGWQYSNLVIVYGRSKNPHHSLVVFFLVLSYW